MSKLLYMIVYGFFLTVLVGLLTSWVERKLTARFQYRVGPPVLQPFIDIVKLFGKETLIPEGASLVTFLGSPLAGLASVIVVSTLLWLNCMDPVHTFMGDLIVTLYFLLIPSISLMLGGFTSRNPLASLGASREMKMILSYELPLSLTVLVPVIKSGFALRMGELINFQTQHGNIASSLSGLLAFLVAIFCIQAKIGLGPFDAAEAETEIAGGLLIEYSGAPLAIFRLMKIMLLCTLPLFLIVLFLGGLRMDGVNLLWSALKYFGIILILSVIKNTNPRVRIDQAVKFFWGPVMALAVLAVILAFRGM